MYSVLLTDSGVEVSGNVVTVRGDFRPCHSFVSLVTSRAMTSEVWPERTVMEVTALYSAKGSNSHCCLSGTTGVRAAFTELRPSINLSAEDCPRDGPAAPHTAPACQRRLTALTPVTVTGQAHPGCPCPVNDELIQPDGAASDLILRNNELAFRISRRP
ncbi:hypothetical protein AAFF_G00116220 [Aldrovandia affinis]|uniref:Uncharacterized protein n=1 Tax=Aldrovandia affinis TaxID=143900 RepID=A0AAD7T3B9_9TELE|nr:hypothetical protein AAFF_G00116220 [Aldrovandia affinis]